MFNLLATATNNLGTGWDVATIVSDVLTVNKAIVFGGAAAVFGIGILAAVKSGIFRRSGKVVKS